MPVPFLTPVGRSRPTRGLLGVLEDWLTDMCRYISVARAPAAIGNGGRRCSCSVTVAALPGTGSVSVRRAHLI